MRKFLLVFLLLPLVSLAQKKQITLDDIYKNGTFRGEFVRGFAGVDIHSYVKEDNVKDEKGQKLPVTDFQLSNDKSKVLFFKDRENIYRRSSKAFTYLYDIASGKTTLLENTKILHASFSPNGEKVAYVKDNNLYIYDIPSGTRQAITTDGKWNYIINGNCDWVYEEEFGFTQAYQWSPGGAYLAYYRFDETDVKEYSMTVYDDHYNEEYRYKYPKAGEQNSKVSIVIYDLANNKKANAEFEQGDIYIPRIKWTQEDDDLVVFWMNRHQNDLKLLSTNPRTGASKVLYEEKNKYYVDIDDDWWFLKDQKHYLFASEMNGYRRLYLYSMDGAEKKEITTGNYDVTGVEGVDEKNQLVYYTMAYPTPMDRHLFVTDFAGKKTTQLTQGDGWHRIEMKDDCTQYYDYFSSINTPQVVSLYDISRNKKKGAGSVLNKVVSQSENLTRTMSEFELGKASFIRIPNSKGDTLNGWMLKPAGFDPQRKYPVLFCNYGGPGSQQVTNRFGAVSFWHQMLAEKGFIVVSVDNTGTGGRGEEFKKKTYLQLGKLEIEDQIDAAKYLETMPWVDRNNIGHWGWSFGGFMSSLAITKGADVFTAAVAVAPVTSWRYYDDIYTERYMRTPQENAAGYDENSPINFTDRIKGKYLIIHGTEDDNVHFQNSVRMITALVKSNVDFESGYYPNKNHRIAGSVDNTTYHLWNKMTEWIFKNLGNENTQPYNSQSRQKKAF